MIFGGKSHGETSYGAILDISSGSVGFAVVESKKSSALPRVIYSNRLPVRTDAHETDLRSVREALLSVALTIAGEGLQVLRSEAPGENISQVFVTCASPWAFTLARNVRYEAHEPFRITKKIIEELMQKAEDEMRATVQEHTEIQEKEFDIVERATVDIAVNDYVVTNPYTLKGKSLALSHVAGLVPQEILLTVKEIEDKLFPQTALKAHTFMLVMYCVLRDVLPKVHSACIVNVTDQSSEFGIVENDLLIGNSYIHTGTTDLLAGSKRPRADVQSFLQEVSKESTIDVAELEPFASTYVEQLTAHVNTILEHRTLPEHLVLSVQEPFGPVFKQLLAQAVLNATGKEPSITLVDQELVHVDVCEPHVPSYDVYTAVAARFFHKLHGCAEIREEE